MLEFRDQINKTNNSEVLYEAGQVTVTPNQRVEGIIQGNKWKPQVLLMGPKSTTSRGLSMNDNNNYHHHNI